MALSLRGLDVTAFATDLHSALQQLASCISQWVYKTSVLRQVILAKYICCGSASLESDFLDKSQFLDYSYFVLCCRKSALEGLDRTIIHFCGIYSFFVASIAFFVISSLYFVQNQVKACFRNFRLTLSFCYPKWDRGKNLFSYGFFVRRFERLSSPIQLEDLECQILSFMFKSLLGQETKQVLRNQIASCILTDYFDQSFFQLPSELIKVRCVVYCHQRHLFLIFV